MKEQAYIREKLNDDDSLNMNDATEESHFSILVGIQVIVLFCKVVASLNNK
jgi:hypothetical protein